MYKFKEYVKASSIWETAEDFEDEGPIDGIIRGYNIEVELKDGSKHWLSCEWFYEDPEVHYNDDFRNWLYEMHGWTPTGRICFRGYGEEEYDPVERDYFIANVGPRSKHDI